MAPHSDNIKIECDENCGNSPKKQLLRDLTIAFAKNEIDFCLDWITDDIVWEIVGDRLIQGKGKYEEALNDLRTKKSQALHIYNIITHGNTGSVNGTLLLTNKQCFSFCDVYNFRGFGKHSKIKAITSYIIETTEA